VLALTSFEGKAGTFSPLSKKKVMMHSRTILGIMLRSLVFMLHTAIIVVLGLPLLFVDLSFILVS
jgi:hypothetical protein